MTNNRLKVGDTIKCSHSREWVELKTELEKEGWILDFKPGMVIEVVGCEFDEEE